MLVIRLRLQTGAHDLVQGVAQNRQSELTVERIPALPLPVLHELATRSVAMSLARPLKAGIEEMS
jgi:hypothetical protein